MSFMMHAIRIGASTDIIGCTDVGVTHGNQHSLLNTDGNVDTSAVFLEAAAPRFAVTSHAVGLVLAEVGILTGTDGAVAVWDAKHLPDGTKDTSGHVKYTMGNARTFIRQISAAIQGNATVALESIGYNASGNIPMNVDVAASDLTAIALNEEAFCLGPVSVNGNTIADVQSVTINPGIGEHIQFRDSAIGVTKVHVDRRSPSIQITTLDPTMQQYIAGGTTPFTGSRAIGGSTVTIKLRRRLPDGTFSATTNNVLITLAHGVVNPVSTAGRRREHVFEIIPRRGTNAVIQVSTSAAA